MDLAEIARRQQAAREFTHAVGDCSFTLRLATAHERRCAIMALVPLPAADEEPRPLAAEELEKLTRTLIERAVVGWQGVTLGHLLPEVDAAAAADPVPWSAAAVPLLLDAQPQWERDLREAYAARNAPRQGAEEADAKN